MNWTTDYHKLQVGDIVKFKGRPGEQDIVLTVLGIHYTSGYGAGMGEQPATWNIVFNDGHLIDYDGWGESSRLRPFVVLNNDKNVGWIQRQTEFFYSDKKLDEIQDEKHKLQERKSQKQQALAKLSEEDRKVLGL